MSEHQTLEKDLGDASASPFFSLKILRGLLLLICQFWLSLYLPVAVMTYSPGWYEFNCQFHERCEVLGSPRVTQRVDDLTRFWRHEAELESIDWTNKERFHLHEARQWFDRALVLSGLLGVIYLLLFCRRVVRHLSLGVMCCALALGAVIPLFSDFWKGTVHAWLFDNDSWKNTPFDISYYLMPDGFFVISFAAMLLAALAINAALYLGCKFSMRGE